MVKSSPFSAGNVGLIPGQETKIAHAMRQLSPWATSREAQEPQGRISHTSTETQCSQKRENKFKGSQAWVPEVLNTKPKFIGQGMILNKG